MPSNGSEVGALEFIVSMYKTVDVILGLVVGVMTGRVVELEHVAIPE